MMENPKFGEDILSLELSYIADGLQISTYILKTVWQYQDIFS